MYINTILHAEILSKRVTVFPHPYFNDDIIKFILLFYDQYLIQVDDIFILVSQEDQ